MINHLYTGCFPDYGHVQGIATDGTYFYFSFTTALLKLDATGRLVGSVTGLLGHLGCIAYHEGRIYGSLEYKNDSIGRSILNKLGRNVKLPDAFYIACFETDKIDQIGIDAEKCGFVTAIRLEDACADYAAPGHRYGCSGIDGITICRYPTEEPALFVAYGIYGDLQRADNDYQVLLRIPLKEASSKFAPLTQNFALSPASVSAADQFFIYTGNTLYGIQNLEYDPTTNTLMAAVYHGKKPEFPNYNLFFFDLSKDPIREGNRSFLTLAPLFEKDEATGIRGSRFPYGSTGIIALGNGFYYFSEDGKAEEGYYTHVHLYRLDSQKGFIKL